MDTDVRTRANLVMSKEVRYFHSFFHYKAMGTDGNLIISDFLDAVSTAAALVAAVTAAELQ